MNWKNIGMIALSVGIGAAFIKSGTDKMVDNLFNRKDGTGTP